MKHARLMLLRFIIFAIPVALTWSLFLFCYLLAFGLEEARTIARAVMEVEE